MQTVAQHAPSALSVSPRTGEPWLPVDLAPVAAELVGTVRDYGPDDIRNVLDQADGRLEHLAVVLAAMVDPDKTPAELLDWTTTGPVLSRDRPPSRHKGPREKKTPLTAAERRRRQNESNRQLKRCPECGREVQSGNFARHRDRHVTQRAA